ASRCDEDNVLVKSETIVRDTGGKSCPNSVVIALMNNRAVKNKEGKILFFFREIIESILMTKMNVVWQFVHVVFLTRKKMVQLLSCIMNAFYQSRCKITNFKMC